MLRLDYVSRNFASMPQITPDAHDIFSVIRAAKELKKSPRTVLHWITSGKIAATKLGPGTAPYVITRDEIERVRTEAQQPAETKEAS